MKTMIHCVLALCVFLALPVFGEQTQPAGSPSTDKEFTQLIQSYYDDWNSLDVDKPAKYYAKDPDLIFFDIAPLQYHSWKEYHDGVVKLVESYKSFKLIPANDLKVIRKGNIVITTLTFHISGVLKDGKPVELECRQSSIWEKRKGTWLIIHEHISTPLTM